MTHKKMLLPGTREFRRQLRPGKNLNEKKTQIKQEGNASCVQPSDPCILISTHDKQQMNNHRHLSLSSKDRKKILGRFKSKKKLE